MPTIDLKAEILNQHGMPYPSPSDMTKKLTLGEVCADALSLPVPNDQDAVKKRLKGELAVRIGLAVRNGHADAMHLTSEEIVMIKEVIGQHFAPVIVYRTGELLDPSPATAKH